MKTPEKIKKGLEVCGENAECGQCPYFHSHAVDEKCVGILLADALVYIQQLERERDAAVEDLSENRKCETCKYFTPGYFCIGCRRGGHWQWRGVQEVE